MGLRRTGIVLLALALIVVAGVVGGCKSTSAGTTSTSGQTTASSEAQTTTSFASTTTTAKPMGASVVSVKIGEVATVEQGELTVEKLTVTDDIASPEANALLLTGASDEAKNASKKAATGKEFLLVTFKYKKDASYGFRGGLYSDDIELKNAAGTTYPMVETKGYGGISQSNAGKVQPGVEAETTAVYEVVKGEPGLKLIYHSKAPDGFTCAIR